MSATATGARQATASHAVRRQPDSRQGHRRPARVLTRTPDGLGIGSGSTSSSTAPAQIRLRILKQGKWIATPFKGQLEPGAQKLEWDGAKRVGRLVDGEYEAVIEAIDAFATTTVAVPFSADTRAPKVRILQRSPLRLWLSEPATVTLRFGTRRLVYEALAAGEAKVPKAPKLGIVRAVAWDAAGNRSKPPPVTLARTLGGCNRLRADPVQSIRTSGQTARWSTRN